MSGTRRKAGRLGPQVEGYRAWLAQRGYTPQTVRNMLKDLGQVRVWMSAAGLETGQLDEDAMVTFLAARQAAARLLDAFDSQSGTVEAAGSYEIDNMWPGRYDVLFFACGTENLASRWFRTYGGRPVSV